MSGQSKEYSKEVLIEKLQCLYNMWGDTEIDTINSCKDMACRSTYERRFGSMKNARKEAGVTKRKYSKGVMRERAKKLMRDYERSDKRVTASNISGELRTAVKASDKPLTELRAGAGLLLSHSTSKKFNTSRVEMIEEIRNMSGVVTDKDLEKESSYPASYYRNIFGTTTCAKNIAGLKTVKGSNGKSELWNRLTGKSNSKEAVASIDGYDKDSEYYVYRLHFTDDYFYIGATSDLVRRMSEREYWPKDKPIDIDIESFNDKKKCNERETEITFETAIEFNTNDVYGGHKKYR